ncbi:MAG: VIT1/CCC1 transporter family protein [Candidatus Omnitrophica bacterium]|nr:VIT1/CCC1 transporter family protein [Candidatus Omnitrophota bacterium]
MPDHVETHFTASEAVRDIVIGMSDGLTVPFALAAGLAGAIDQSRIIVTAGLAEIAAGSIAMGLGGYLAAKSETEHYDSERKREEREIVEKTAAEEKEVADILETYGLTSDQSSLVVAALKQRPAAWIDFMMRFELGLEKPDPRRALASARNIALAYIAGGFIPLGPYLFQATASAAFKTSILVTAIALGLFGAIKGRFTGTSPSRSGFQTVLIGGLAAAAAYLLAKAIS